MWNILLHTMSSYLFIQRDFAVSSAFGCITGPVVGKTLSVPQLLPLVVTFLLSSNAVKCCFPRKSETVVISPIMNIYFIYKYIPHTYLYAIFVCSDFSSAVLILQLGPSGEVFISDILFNFRTSPCFFYSFYFSGLSIHCKLTFLYFAENKLP